MSSNELSLYGVCVQSLLYNGTEWSALSKGFTRLDVYFNRLNSTYRLVGVKLEDMSVIIQILLNPTTQFRLATETFCQIADPKTGSVYGFNFASKDDASAFIDQVKQAVSGKPVVPAAAAAPPPPAPAPAPIPTPAPTVPAPPQSAPPQPPTSAPQTFSPPQPPQTTPIAAPVAPAAPQPPASNENDGSLASALMAVKLKKKDDSIAAPSPQVVTNNNNYNPNIASMAANLNATLNRNNNIAKNNTFGSNVALNSAATPASVAIPSCALKGDMLILKEEITREIKKEIDSMKAELLTALNRR